MLKFLFLRLDLLSYLLLLSSLAFFSLESARICLLYTSYEYINLGLPMLGALPNGDALQLINEKKYGFSCDYRAVEEVRTGIYKFQKKIFLNSCRNNIMEMCIRDRRRA